MIDSIILENWSIYIYICMNIINYIYLLIWYIYTVIHRCVHNMSQHTQPDTLAFPPVNLGSPRGGSCRPSRKPFDVIICIFTTGGGWPYGFCARFQVGQTSILVELLGGWCGSLGWNPLGDFQHGVFGATRVEIRVEMVDLTQFLGFIFFCSFLLACKPY